MKRNIRISIIVIMVLISVSGFVGYNIGSRASSTEGYVLEPLCQIREMSSYVDGYDDENKAVHYCLSQCELDNTCLGNCLNNEMRKDFQEKGIPSPI